MRVALTIAAVLFAAGCRPSWDLEAVAREQCGKYEARHLVETQTRIARIRVELGQSKAVDELVEFERRLIAYDLADFLSECQPLAIEAIGPCAAEFTPGTDSADQCVTRRINDAKLGRAIRAASEKARTKP